MDIFNLLLETEQLCREKAVHLPRQEIATQTWEGITIKIGENKFLLSLDEVREVISYPNLAIAPGTVNWLIGIANLRGMILSVIDLQGFISSKMLRNPRRGKVIIARNSELLVGFLVERVYGLAKFDIKEKISDVQGIEDSYTPYIKGLCVKDSQNWRIISIESLINSTKLYKIALK